MTSDNLAGGIANELGMFHQLTALSLAFNYFTGTLPTHLENLKSLTALNLGNNLLVGYVQPFFSTFVNLTFLNLDGNFFYGSMPDVSSLNHLDTCFLPSTLCNAGSLPAVCQPLLDCVVNFMPPIINNSPVIPYKPSGASQGYYSSNTAISMVIGVVSAVVTILAIGTGLYLLHRKAEKVSEGDHRKWVTLE